MNKILILIFSIIGIISILMQNRTEGLGTMFGGGGENYKQRDFIQNILMLITIISAIVVSIASFISNL